MPTRSHTLTLPTTIRESYALIKRFDLLVAFMKQSQPAMSFEVQPREGSGEFRRGTEYSIRSKGPGAKFFLELQVAEENPPHSLLLSGSQTLQQRYEMRYTLTEVPEGTQVRMDISFTTSMGVLGMLISPIAAALQQSALAIWGKFLQEAATKNTLPDGKAPQHAVVQQSTKVTESDFSGVQQAATVATEGTSFGFMLAIIAASVAAYYFL